MAVHIRHFDRDKALEVILYIAGNLSDATLHSISKILYLADKLHLQEYGRLICGDRYVAMEYGPVPSAIYDMMKVAAKRASIDVDWDEMTQNAMGVMQGRNIVPKRGCNMDLISESEIECLQQIIADYGDKSFGELTDITHDSAWEETDENQTMAVDSIVNALANASEVANYLHAH